MDTNKDLMEFTALTYNNSVYHFSITKNGEISCVEFGITTTASIIEIKPNFVLRRADGSTIYNLDDHLRNRNLKKPNGESLVFKWDIPENVLEYLINNKKLMYSTEIALLYGFPTEFAHDINYKRREIERIKNKTPRAEKHLNKLRTQHEHRKFN